MRIAVVVLVLAACSGKKVGLHEIRDHMCACRDAACAMKADAELTAWLSSDEATLGNGVNDNLVVEIGECAMTARGR